MTHLTGQALESFRDYLSNHDFDQLTEIWLLPLTANGQHVGVVLIAESVMDRLDTDARGILFSSVARLVATRISQPHYGDQDNLPARAVVLGPDGLAEEAERLARNGQRNLIIAKVDVAAAVYGISENHTAGTENAMDRHRLAQEITRLIASMLAAQGHVGTTRDGHTIAVLAAGSNLPLLLHQAGQGLRKLFPELEEPPRLLKTQVVWDTAATDFTEAVHAVAADG